MNDETTREPRRELDPPFGVPVDTRLERRSDGRLWAVRNGDARPVRVSRCFPWSEPGRYLSLRDAEEEEVALVRETADLEPASRKVLEEALVEAGFVLEVEAILEVEEEIEIRAWKVRTAQGIRSFQTPRDEWPRDVPGGGVLIRDVAGDLYHVRDPGRLDETSRRLFWAFAD